MKTTKELYGIDPKTFKGKFYEEVLTIKRKEMEERRNSAIMETYKIGYMNLTDKQKTRIAKLDAIILEANKALKYIRMWQDEME
jgi:hypothetical protein